MENQMEMNYLRWVAKFADGVDGRSHVRDFGHFGFLLKIYQQIRNLRLLYSTGIKVFQLDGAASEIFCGPTHANELR